MSCLPNILETFLSLCRMHRGFLCLLNILYIRMQLFSVRNRSENASFSADVVYSYGMYSEI